MSDTETRTVTAPITREDDPATGEHRLSGYAALFNSEATIGGFFREVIKPGAFTEAIKRHDDVRALFNHDPNFILGRTTAGTLTLREDERGLRYDVIAPGTTWARDLATSVARGDISQSSFAFRVESDAWPKVERGELPLREIRQVELFDVSPVTYPAYEDTTVSARDRASALAHAASETQAADRTAHARRRNRITRSAKELNAS